MNQESGKAEKTPKRSPAKKKETFEQSLERLGALCDRMAAPDLALEESIELYTQGVRLVETCQDALEKARLRVQTLETGAAEGKETGKAIYSGRQKTGRDAGEAED